MRNLVLLLGDWNLTSGDCTTDFGQRVGLMLDIVAAVSRIPRLPEIDDEPRYLLQNVSAGYVGNEPAFWAKGGSGYTVDPYDAEPMAMARVEEIVNSTQGSHQWCPWLMQDVLASLRPAVDMDKLRTLQENGT